MRSASLCSFLLIGTATLLFAGPALAFSVKFSWNGIAPCSTTSPAFLVSGAPSGTTALAFAMRDKEAPDFRHGGSTVSYAGTGNIPKGAITYVGPCPPSGETHHYVWTTKALAGNGATLASTTAEGQFP